MSICNIGQLRIQTPHTWSLLALYMWLILFDAQARADLVGAKAQAAADCAIDCEGICAQEVKAALDANHDLVCGEFK